MSRAREQAGRRKRPGGGDEGVSRDRPAVAPEAGEASSAESRLRQTAMADRVGQGRSSG